MGKMEQLMGVSRIDDYVAFPFPFVSVRGLEKNSGKPLMVIDEKLLICSSCLGYFLSNQLLTSPWKVMYDLLTISETILEDICQHFCQHLITFHLCGHLLTQHQNQESLDVMFQVFSKEGFLQIHHHQICHSYEMRAISSFN